MTNEEAIRQGLMKVPPQYVDAWAGYMQTAQPMVSHETSSSSPQIPVLHNNSITKRKLYGDPNNKSQRMVIDEQIFEPTKEQMQQRISKDIENLVPIAGPIKLVGEVGARPQVMQAVATQLEKLKSMPVVGRVFGEKAGDMVVKIGNKIRGFVENNEFPRSVGQHIKDPMTGKDYVYLSNDINSNINHEMAHALFDDFIASGTKTANELKNEAIKLFKQYPKIGEIATTGRRYTNKPADLYEWNARVFDESVKNGVESLPKPIKSYFNKLISMR